MQLGGNAYIPSAMNTPPIVAELVDRAKRAGLTMSEVCRRAGVAETTPSRWKSGIFEPRFRTVAKMTAVIDEAERENDLDETLPAKAA